MQQIAEYEGNLLNHVEALYRPGERQLAVELATALGCTISDTGFKGDGEETFLAVHPNPEDMNVQNNAFYISPMRPEQQQLEAYLKALSVADQELTAKLEGYREAARTKPFGVAHFALRYATSAAVQHAADAVQRSLGAQLGERLNVRLFRPEQAESAQRTIVQGFVYQDVIVSGSFLYGQLIELQARAPG
jgi:hypothetical protein